jgi:hypothetical protein
MDDALVWAVLALIVLALVVVAVLVSRRVRRGRHTAPEASAPSPRSPTTAPQRGTGRYEVRILNPGPNPDAVILAISSATGHLAAVVGHAVAKRQSFRAGSTHAQAELLVQKIRAAGGDAEVVRVG